MKREMHLCIDVFPIDLDVVRVCFSSTLYRLKKNYARTWAKAKSQRCCYTLSTTRVFDGIRLSQTSISPIATGRINTKQVNNFEYAKRTKRILWRFIKAEI